MTICVFCVGGDLLRLLEKKVREERGTAASSAGLVAEAAPERQGRFQPGRSSVPAAARCGAFHPGSSPAAGAASPSSPPAFRQSRPEGWLHVARQPGLEGGVIVCPGTQAPLSDARPPELAEQSLQVRVRDCKPAVGPQGGWAEGVGPHRAGPVRAGRAAGTTSTGPRGGEHLPPAGCGAELGASWGSHRLPATADAGGGEGEGCKRAVVAGWLRHCPLAGGMFH